VPPARVPDALRGRVFRGSAAVRDGLLTPGQLRGPAWRSLFQDVYVDATVPESHALRARAAARVLLPGAVVAGASAAVLWGVDLAGPGDDVELVLPPGSHARRVSGVRVRRAALDPDDIRVQRRVRLTAPAATAVRVAGFLPADEAVVALDRLVVAGVVGLDAVRERAARRGGASPRARAACARADGLAESPQETRVRLLLDSGRLPAPVAQHVVRDEDGFVARVDFAWPDRRVALEYDGAWHGDRAQPSRDRRRLNRLQAAGWRVVFVTAADLYRPAQLLATVAAALS
jgi:very-short-patch-repair endonuclease